ATGAHQHHRPPRRISIPRRGPSSLCEFTPPGERGSNTYVRFQFPEGFASFFFTWNQKEFCSCPKKFASIPRRVPPSFPLRVPPSPDRRAFLCLNPPKGPAFISTIVAGTIILVAVLIVSI